MKLRLFAACIAALAGCDKANFNSGSEKAAPPEKLEIGCGTDNKYTENELSLGIKGGKEAEMFLEGEFCPQAPAELRILFTVDFSLSMYNKDAEPKRGNDQVKNGTCGRLEAAKALVQKQIENYKGKELDTVIKVGVVQFASGLVGKVPFTDVKEFEKELTVENFCQGIDATNYKLAFEESQKILKDEKGAKILYFISDGLPTVGGGGEQENAPRHREAAQKAVEELRASQKNLVFNTIFLGNVHELSEPNFDPSKFLNDLTGDPERVKLVEKAEDLAKEALELEAPKVVLDPNSKRATVKADGAAEAEVPFVLFEAHASKEQVWTFRTGAFKAFPGAALASQLTIYVKDKDGEPYQVTFKIAPEKAANP